MQHISTTPFGQRPVTAGLLAAQAAASRAPALSGIDKWAVFDAVRQGREVWGLGDRALVVLNALLSFHPGRTLDAGASLIVFPSNESLSARAHGMAESTLRRHLAALTDSGLILRHDSPNGKRYAIRHGAAPDLARAFGFDLRPLLVRAAEIGGHAAEVRARADRIAAVREVITLRKRDVIKLARHALETGVEGPWQAILERSLDLHGRLRRRLDEGQLNGIRDQVDALLAETRAAFGAVETGEPGGCDSRTGRHVQSSDTEYMDRKEAEKKPAEPVRILPALTLVLAACPDLEPYADRPIRGWSDLAAVTDMVAPMLGIDGGLWHAARAAMGEGGAAATVACMLQRAGDIRNPGAYLRTLVGKARRGEFCPGPMVRALAG